MLIFDVILQIRERTFKSKGVFECNSGPKRGHPQLLSDSIVEANQFRRSPVTP